MSIVLTIAIILAFIACWVALDWIDDNVNGKLTKLVLGVVIICGYIFILDSITNIHDRDTIREALLGDGCVTTNQVVDKPVIEKIGNEYFITNDTEQLFEYQCNSRNQYLKSPNLEQ